MNLSLVSQILWYVIPSTPCPSSSRKAAHVEENWSMQALVTRAIGDALGAIGEAGYPADVESSRSIKPISSVVARAMQMLLMM
jgi:hypothetical protein